MYVNVTFLVYEPDLFTVSRGKIAPYRPFYRWHSLGVVLTGAAIWHFVMLQKQTGV